MDAVTRPAFARDDAVTLDGLAERLRERRRMAGGPSFSEIARRVAQLRAARGVHASERTPGRVTIYDCFRDGRRRVDVDLVVDIVRALGGDDQDAARWRSWSVEAQRRQEASAFVSSRSALPPVVEPFVGREPELAAIVDAAGPVVIAGMPGVGKTQLAHRALIELARRERVAGAIVVDARGTGDDAGAPRRRAVRDAIARALGLEADHPGARGARVAEIAEALARANLAVLVDDVSAPDQVRDLVDRVVATPLVITSRTALDLDGVVTVDVVPWTPADTIDLLGEAIGADRLRDDPASVDEIVDLVGGLPLAAALTASRLGARPDWTLRDHRDALRASRDALRLDDAVAATMSLSYAALPPAARRGLRLLATQPCDDLSSRQFAALLGADAGAETGTDDDAAAVEALLVAAHCAERPDDGRIALHGLVRTFAAARSWDEDPQAERDAALDRLAESYLTDAWAAVEALYPGHLSRARTPGRSASDITPADATAWLARETGGLAAVWRATTERRPGVVIEASEALGRHFERQGMHRLGMELHRRALDASRRLGDVAGIAAAENQIGQTALRTGQDEAVAHLERAVEFAREAGLPRVLLSASNALAIVAAQNGDLDEALARFLDAREAALAAGFDELVPPLTDNVAIMHRRLGDLDAAAAMHRRAYDLALARGDRGMAATALANVSEVQLLNGDPSTAAASATRAGELAASAANVATRAYALTNLGAALLALEDPEGARDRHLEALAMARAMGDPVLAASILVSLAAAHVALGDPAQATTVLEEALETADAAGTTFERGRALLGLARIDAGAGKVDAARAKYEASIAAFAGAPTPEVHAARDELAALAV